MNRYRISDQAKADLSDIWFHISEDSRQAADRFISTLVDKFRTLARFPRMGRLREELTLRLRSFAVGSYVIYYRPAEGCEPFR